MNKQFERMRQQVKAEADSEHSREKEGYKQEFLQQSQINEAEAQIIINQVHQQAQQEAQHYVGSVLNYAEQAHIIRLGEERVNAEAKADQEEKRAKI